MLNLKIIDWKVNENRIKDENPDREWLQVKYKYE